MLDVKSKAFHGCYSLTLVNLSTSVNAYAEGLWGGMRAWACVCGGAGGLFPSKLQALPPPLCSVTAPPSSEETLPACVHRR